MSDSFDSEGQPVASNVGSGDYVVQQSECLESIAFDTGFFWKTLWELPENADLKEARKNPNTLLPGDRVTIPKLRIESLSRPANARHKFKRLGVPAVLKVHLLDGGNPRAGIPCVLIVDGISTPVTTDGDGAIQHPVSPKAGSVKLIVNDPKGKQEINLSARGLDPLNTPSGVQGRLANLGFQPGPINGIIGPSTRGAIMQFQDAQHLKVDGIAGPKTLAKLKEVCGS